MAAARGRVPAAEVLAAVRGEASAVSEAQPAESLVWSGCPYLGLVPFGERDARVFYGRGELVAQLVQRLAGRGAGNNGPVSTATASSFLNCPGVRYGTGWSSAWPERVVAVAGPLADLAASVSPGLLIRERVLGPEHPDTLIARGSLAHLTGETGDAGGARDQFAALLPVIERMSGPEHPDTLTARRSLAHLTGETGDAGGARDQIAALLPVIERVLGPEHPDTLTARNELATWTGAAVSSPRPGVH